MTDVVTQAVFRLHPSLIRRTSRNTSATTRRVHSLSWCASCPTPRLWRPSSGYAATAKRTTWNPITAGQRTFPGSLDGLLGSEGKARYHNSPVSTELPERTFTPTVTALPYAEKSNISSRIAPDSRPPEWCNSFVAFRGTALPVWRSSGLMSYSGCRDVLAELDDSWQATDP